MTKKNENADRDQEDDRGVAQPQPQLGEVLDEAHARVLDSGAIFFVGGGQGGPRARDGLSSRFALRRAVAQVFLGPGSGGGLPGARRQQIALRETLGGVRAIAREAGDGRRHPRQAHPVGGRRVAGRARAAAAASASASAAARWPADRPPTASAWCWRDRRPGWRSAASPAARRRAAAPPRSECSALGVAAARGRRQRRRLVGRRRRHRRARPRRLTAARRAPWTVRGDRPRGRRDRRRRWRESGAGSSAGARRAAARGSPAGGSSGRAAAAGAPPPRPPRPPRRASSPPRPTFLISIAALQLVRVQRHRVAQLLERLAERVVERDLVLDVRGRLADLADELPQPGRQLGQLLGTEKDQGEHQDDGDLARAEVEHGRKFNSINPEETMRDRRFYAAAKQIDLPRRANPVGGEARARARARPARRRARRPARPRRRRSPRRSGRAGRSRRRRGTSADARRPDRARAAALAGPRRDEHARARPHLAPLARRARVGRPEQRLVLGQPAGEPLHRRVGRPRIDLPEGGHRIQDRPMRPQRDAGRAEDARDDRRQRRAARSRTAARPPADLSQAIRAERLLGGGALREHDLARRRSARRCRAHRPRAARPDRRRRRPGRSGRRRRSAARRARTAATPRPA